MNRNLTRLTAPWVALLSLSACGGRTTDGEPDPAAPRDVAREADAGELASSSSDLREAPIANDSVIVTLGETPESLRDAPLDSPAWVQWLQSQLGTTVQVVSARPLHRGQQASRAAGLPLLVHLTATERRNIEAALERVRARGNLLAADANAHRRPDAAPTDPLSGSQWHLDRIGVPEAWDVTRGSAEVVVAVIDTGVRLDHEDLEANIWHNAREIPGDGEDNDENSYVDDVTGWDFVSLDASQVSPDDDPGPPDNEPLDVYGHGTKMAGIIAARADNDKGVAGIAPQVKIMPLRSGYLEGPEDGSFQDAASIEAIYYAADNGADIINMSFGGTLESSALRAALDYAASRGVLLVASAGNAGRNTMSYPGSYPNVIAVAAIEKSGERSDRSTYGRWVDIAAPGYEIWTTTADGGYGWTEGTSPAAAVVSGVAALALSAHPELTREQLTAQLLSSAVPLPESNDPFESPTIGAGLVYAPRAVTEIARSRAYLVSVRTQEDTGNGNHQLERGERGAVDVAWHVTAARHGLHARLISTDPNIARLEERVALNVADDTMALVKLRFDISEQTPSDHPLQLVVELADDSGKVLSTPLTIPLNYVVRNYATLPFAERPLLLPQPDGTELFIADYAGAGPGGARRLFSAVRHADGSFEPRTPVAQSSSHECRPDAVVLPNGDVELAYSQYVTPPNTNGKVAFVAHTRYEARVQSWSPFEHPPMASLYPLARNHEEDGPSIEVDGSGRVHIAWAGGGVLGVARQDLDGSWEFDEVSDGVFAPSSAVVDLVRQGEALLLFVRPNPSDDRDAGPVYVLEFDGTTWSAPVVTEGTLEGTWVGRPFATQGKVYRFQSPYEGGPTRLAEFDAEATRWAVVRTVAPDSLLPLRKQSSALALGPSVSAIYAVDPLSNHGTLRLAFGLGSAVLGVFGEANLSSSLPRLLEGQDGSIHAFARQDSIDNLAMPLGTRYSLNRTLDGSAVTSTPVVLDDGDFLVSARELHASWSATDPSGIANYRVAWGTAPGTDDIVPWTETTATELYFDLGTRYLLPNQTVYASVIAQSAGIYRSPVGVSDGIRVEARGSGEPCTAPAWNASTVYRDVGLRVSYEGAIYSNLYYNSGNVPGTEWGAWTFVRECNLPVVLPRCFAPSWEAGASYDVGARVVDGAGQLFEAEWQPGTEQPTGAHGNPWKWQGACVLLQP